MPTAAAISAGGAIIGGGLNALGSYFGQKAQTQYGEQAISAIQQMFQQSQQALNPFITGGQNAFSQLQQYLPTFTTPFGATPGSGPTGAVNPQSTLAALRATPGYQFALDQGLKSTTNAFTAQGLGGAGSGNLGKGLINYSEGLADTTYQQQFTNYLQQLQQQYGMFLGPSSVGAGAAGSLSQAAGQAGTGISNMLAGIGNAQAGALTAGASAIGGGISNAANAITLPALLQYMQSLRGGGGTAVAPFAGIAGNPYSSSYYGGSVSG
jgi:hypothetical protein